ncbi:MAG: D-2-hydroxyacid dehydrogenase [Gemmatimonadota bacterium]
MTTVLFASWLEPELVARVRAVSGELEVVYEPELLRPPRYPADHGGAPLERTPEQEVRWREHLGRAEVLFDFDRTHLDDLPELAPGVRWIQATSAGIGQLVHRLGYARRMPHTVFTTASGVHARPLAEFALMAMLMHVRRTLHVTRAQRSHTWERFAGTDLEGRTVVVLGMGAIGTEVARRARAFGMRVVGVKRRPKGADPATLSVDELHGPDALGDLLPRADFLVLVAPHTDETEGMVGARELAALPAGAVLVNIGRGALVDEPTLVEHLRSGHLGGAYLDVFAEEPLPPDSPLWDMPDVLVSPHSASTSDRENARITDLFCDNLRRFLDGRPLRNVLDPRRLY